LSYDFDVINHDGQMYVFTNNYSLGGTILSGMIGAYIGYKIGRAKPQKKGFETEKKIGRKIKGAFSKKKYAKGGGIDNKKRFDVYFYDSSLDTSSDEQYDWIVRANSLEEAIKEAEQKAFELKKNYLEIYHRHLFLGSIDFAQNHYFREGGGYNQFIEKYAQGGGVSYIKNWEVIGINKFGKMFKEKITLGRMSDKEDVKNALRRRTDLNIREITSIKEVFAKGGNVNTGRSWHQDRRMHNKSESYEKPMSSRKSKFAGGGKAKGVEWMKSDGQYEAYLGELYLIISPSTERGLYQVRVKKGYRGETIGVSQNEISGLDKAKDLAYDIAGDYYKQFGDGGGVHTMPDGRVILNSSHYEDGGRVKYYLNGFEERPNYIFNNTNAKEVRREGSKEGGDLIIYFETTDEDEYAQGGGVSGLDDLIRG
jgi:hypothetical protein